MKNILVILLMISFFCFVGYGLYWVGKKFSYVIFYEAFVKETVVDMVKDTCLRSK